MEGTDEIRICYQRIEYWRLRFVRVLTSVLYDLARTTAEGCYCQESWEPQPVWWSTYAREGLSALEKWRNQERELGETEL